MAVEVREVRVGEVEAAVAFAQGAGSTVEAERVVPGASLLAWDGDQPIGALLGLKSDDGAHEMELTLAVDTDPAVGQRLIDTALLKLRSQHITKARLRVTGEAHAAAVWSAANWRPDTLAGDTNDKAA